MIGREVYLRSLPASYVGRCSLVRVVEFNYDQFRIPDSEQHVEVHRGWRADFDDLVNFWVDSFASQDWTQREDYFVPCLQRGKCRPILEAEFNTVVLAHCRELLQPPQLPLHATEGFARALEMYDDWNDVAVVAEYADEFIAFYWETTA